MQWTEPDFTEISLNMEVTAYVLIGDDSEPLIDMSAVDMRGEKDESVSTGR